jgi:uncharacterized protein YgbK (DUF1537 family)
MLTTIGAGVAPLLAALQAQAAPAKEPAAPLKVLIVSGGCCHTYAQQRELLEHGLKARMPAEVSHVYHDPGPGDRHRRVLARGVLWTVGRL